MSSLRQAAAITAINLRSIPQRVGTSLVICVGIAGVVAVLVTVLAMSTGLQSTIASAGRPDRAIVLRGGALAEGLSTITRDDLIAIEAAPGIARTPNGKFAISPEALLSVNLPRASDGQPSALSVRGVTAVAADVRPEITLVEGRMFKPGLHEIVVGKSARDQFAHMNIGDVAKFYNGDWTVVGRFESHGDVHESEVLTDAETLMSAANRTVFSGVTVALESPQSFEAFKQALLQDPTLKVDVQRETEYYEGQSKGIATLLGIVANTVGAIMAIGALFGALNTMYSAVSARTVEIATLRAVGFGSWPVVVSVLVEAQALALAGALFGGAIAWILFNGSTFSTGGSLGQVALRLHVGAPLIALGIVWAAVIGLIGGLFPAIRAARTSVANALRVV
ncbi:MAG TPA: ABC transporter permease [Pseudomonadales bacterium]|nr:ABC transporter permease [Pseudomonadales bacterium]